MQRFSCRRWLLVTLIASVAAGGELGPESASLPTQQAEGNTNAWLNVRDLGASGSKFETRGSTTDGSKQITVADAGDFKVGQGVMVSRCNIRYINPTLWGPGEPYIGASKDTGMEIRGYDGAAGSWIVFLLEMDSAEPTFRWSDDLARSWKGTKVPVTYDWQPLGSGVEVRFSRRDWKPGHMISFSARDQLVSTIEKIEGNVLTLRDGANRTASDAVVRHCDSMALQAAFDRAIREKKNVFIPVGRYRLATGLFVRNAGAIAIEGQSSEDTILDISDGQGACLALDRGTEVTVRNLRLVGHTGLAEQPGAFRTSSGFSFWACTLKSCSGASINDTERVLFENVHASRMASECFISGGPYRRGAEEPKQYTKSATFLRCSVTDCAANAFNNCDFAENTSVLYCRINGAGWHAYEGSGRFIRFIGNYVRNAGPVTVGDIPHTLPREDHYHDLGIGQAVVRDNVFEGIGRCGGVTAIYGTTQVVIANNLFINYNGNAIHASSATVHNNYPSRNITISGNIIDLTCIGEKPSSRIGINVSATDTLVHDNQIYVRGACDTKVTGLQFRDGALNVNAHDNLIRNCGRGITTQRLSGTITETADSRTFRQTGLPLEWRTSHLYRNWNLVWLKSNKPAGESVMDGYDPAALQFKLKEPHDIKIGDSFEVFPPSANWNIHDNTITGCQQPVALTSHGSDTSFFRDNLIERGGATNATQAIVITGRFQLNGNHIAGFDEKNNPKTKQ